MEIQIKVFTPEQAIHTEIEHIYYTGINGLLYIERPVYIDERGFFREIGNVPDIERIIGLPFDIKQLNHSCSEPRVIRGIHAEGWNKLVTALTGEAFCALVDLRPQSSTFLSVITVILKGGVGSLYIPQGVGNSFCVTSTGVFHYVYAVDRVYENRDPSDNKALNVLDPQLGIQWPFPAEDLIISDRDRNAISLQGLFPEYSFDDA